MLGVSIHRRHCSNIAIYVKESYIVFDRGAWAVNLSINLNDWKIDNYLRFLSTFSLVEVTSSIEDEPIWSLNSKVLLSVKWYYLHMTKRDEESEKPPSSLVRKVKAPPRVASFASKTTSFALEIA